MQNKKKNNNKETRERWNVHQANSRYSTVLAVEASLVAGVSDTSVITRGAFPISELPALPAAAN